MKSKIQIDLDWDNQPIIRITHVDSEDVRDKMVKRFLQDFEGSSFAKIHFDQNVSEMMNKNNSNLVIRPIKGSVKTEEMLEIFIKENV